MRILFTILLILGFTLGQAQNKNVILTKATATWCPNCGLWGWDYKDALLEEFPSGPMTFIAAHFGNSALENEASLWFTRNLSVVGQPKFYVNNDNNLVGSSTWNSQFDNVRQEILAKAQGEATISFDGVAIDGETTSCTVATNYSAQAGTEYTIAVYVYENNVEFFQSAKGSDAIHANIMRSSLGEPQGVPYDPATGSYDFEDIIEADWNKEELGLLAVLYRVDGTKYIIEESASVSNFALKTSNEDLLEASLFGYMDRAAELIITADDQQYDLTLTDMSGRLAVKTQFRNEVSISKDQTPTGMYVATFRTDKGFYSQQIFIK